MRKPSQQTSFAFRYEWLDIISELSPKETQDLMRAIRLHINGQPYKSPDDRYLQSIYDSILSDIDAETQARRDMISRCSTSQKARWQQRREQQAEDTPKVCGSSPEEPTPAETPPAEATPAAAPVPAASAAGSTAPEESPRPKSKPRKPASDPESLSIADASPGAIISIKGKKVVVRGKGKVFVIPTIDEIQAYITEKGYHFDARLMYDHYSASQPQPWCLKNGEPVKSWKQCCSTFEGFRRKDLARGQPQVSPAVHQNITDKQYADF